MVMIQDKDWLPHSILPHTASHNDTTGDSLAGWWLVATRRHRDSMISGWADTGTA